MSKHHRFGLLLKISLVHAGLIFCVVGASAQQPARSAGKPLAKSTTRTVKTSPWRRAPTRTAGG